LLLLLQLLPQRLELLLRLFECGVGRRGSEWLAEGGVDAAIIAAGGQSSQHALALRSHPDAHVERRAFRRLPRSPKPAFASRSPAHRSAPGWSAGRREIRSSRATCIPRWPCRAPSETNYCRTGLAG